MLGIDLAGGAFVFLLFIITFTIAVAYSLYGRRSSGIRQQPYGKIYGSAPGAMRSSDSRPRGRDRDVVTWTHGTR